MAKQNQRQAVAISDVYTAILAIATFAVAATAGFVVFKSMAYYDTIFKIVDAAGR